MKAHFLMPPSPTSRSHGLAYIQRRIISPSCIACRSVGLRHRRPPRPAANELHQSSSFYSVRRALPLLQHRTLSTTSSGKSNDPYESPYTLPNALTLARIAACPFLGYFIVHGEFEWASGMLLASGLSDWLDGWLARRWNAQSVLGSILDPAADKALMTTLVGTLTWTGLLPLPLAVLIFGRDAALTISAFYFRYISLPRPRTWRRYFDPSIPSAEVKPTQISKVNTALQLLLMGATTVSPLLPVPLNGALWGLQWIVAGTTIWSGLSYLGSSGVRILSPRK